MIVCGTHLSNVHAVLVSLDFLGEEIKSTIVTVDDDLAIFRAWRIVTELRGQIVGKTVAHIGGLVIHGIEYPVVFGRQAHQGDVVGRYVIIKARFESVGLLVVSLRGGTATLNADTAAIAQVSCIVLVGQVIDGGVIDIQDFHGGANLGLIGNIGSIVGIYNDNRQIGR